MEIYGPKQSIRWLKSDLQCMLVFYILSVLTVGLLPLIVFLYPQLMVRYTSVKCLPSEAEYVALQSGEEMVYITVHHNEVIHDQTLAMRHDGDVMYTEQFVWFEYNCQRYLCSEDMNYTMMTLAYTPHDFNQYLLLPNTESLSAKYAQRQQLLQVIYGPNQLDLPDVKVAEVLVKTMFHPFYLFQYFATTVWIIETYYLFAILILIVTIGGIYLTTKEVVYNRRRLRELAGQATNVTILSFVKLSKGTTQRLLVSRWEPMTSSNLVPGDAFIVSPGMVLPCDAILVQGSIVVDESMLTGESVPVSKQPIHPEEFVDEMNSASSPRSRVGTISAYETECAIDFASRSPASMLFGGTTVQSTYPPTYISSRKHDSSVPSYASDVCVAICYRTGFSSAKGQLIASLLESKNDVVSFFSDSLWVIFYMVILATGLYFVTAWRLLEDDVSWGEVLLKYFDIITVAVPPGLTACLTIATTIALNRLGERHIFVGDTNRISWAGLVNVLSFDKTGTLTEESLRFESILLAEGYSDDRASSSGFKLVREIQGGNCPKETVELLATCHSLSLQMQVQVADASQNAHLTVDVERSVVSSNRASKIIGDSLEIELFRQTGWILAMEHGSCVCKPPSVTTDTSRLIVKHYPFSPDSMRSATLVQRLESNEFSQLSSATSKIPFKGAVTANYFVKGSPEIIASLCVPESVPASFSAMLSSLTKKGLRVLGFAFRPCHETVDVLRSWTQAEFETKSKLRFLGLVTLSSTLKPESISTIRALHQARITVNMITGDHIQTAVAVAKQCRIIDGEDLVPGTPSTPALHVTHYYATEGIDASSYSTLSTMVPGSPLLEDDRSSATVARLVVIDASTNGTGTANDLNATLLLIDNFSGLPVRCSLSTLLDAAAITSYGWATFRQGIHNSRAPEKSFRENLSSKEDHPLLSKRPNTAGNGVNSAVLKLGPTEIAITGRALQCLMSNASMHSIACDIVRYGKVFARMKPADKRLVVELIQSQDAIDLRLRNLLWRSGRIGLATENTTPDSWMESSPQVDINSDWFGRQLEHLNDDAVKAARANLQHKRPRNVFCCCFDDSMNLNSNFLEDDCKLRVMYCGDGANDVSALRASAVGVSLCDSQTSVAAPITSREPSPAVVLSVLGQGRCSLITAYSLIIFNIMYAFVQLLMACLLYGNGLILSSDTYLIQDLGFAFGSSIVISEAPPEPTLHEDMPPQGFFNKYMILKLLLQKFSYVVFQILSLQLLFHQSWYVSDIDDVPLTEDYSYESTTLNTMALCQLWISSMVASIGHPFRIPWYHNRDHIVLLLLQLVWILTQLFAPYNTVTSEWFSIKPVPFEFGLQLGGLMMCQCLISYIINEFADSFRIRRVSKHI